MQTLYATSTQVESYIHDPADLPDGLSTYIAKASRHIDILTFGRINAIGYDRLTAYQKEILAEVTAQLTVFEIEHEDELTSMVSSYSINGVSMSFGETPMVKVMSGVVIPSDIYEQLKMTGLTCRVI